MEKQIDKIDKKVSDYNFAMQVIEFSKWLWNENNIKNISFRTERKDELRWEIIEMLKKKKPDELQRLISSGLLDTLNLQDEHIWD